MDADDIISSNEGSNAIDLEDIPSPKAENVLVIDSDSDSPEHQSESEIKSADQARDTYDMSEVPRNESVKSLSSLSELSTSEDTARHELKKLSLDLNGTFMIDFDPEKSQREMRKMNRRIYSREAKKSQIYDDKGILLESLADLCDCLDKNCSGCHFPCQRCGSTKCGVDCRCNRKYIIDFIEVEGTDTVRSFPT